MTVTGSVVDTLLRMRGVWHDTLHAFHPDGTPMEHDSVGSVHGPFPYDNLVYIDFDGQVYRQTNVTFRGRPTKVRSFTAHIVDGVLHFARLGPDDPGHVGVSAGPGRIIFCSSRTDAPGLHEYNEPDYVEVTGPGTRQRTTMLYRHGVLVRTLAVSGVRLAATADRRLPDDPRGPDGPVHQDTSTTNAFTGGTDG
jgi:hypothetical protein